MKRRFRSPTTWLAIFALLFAQMATAAYACPQLMEKAAVAHAPDCDHGANPDPNLCQRHCDDGKFSLETPKSFDTPDMAVAFARPLVVAAIVISPRAARCARIATGPPPTRSPVLRI
jgi:hypothetical protein